MKAKTTVSQHFSMLKFLDGHNYYLYGKGKTATQKKQIPEIHIETNSRYRIFQKLKSCFELIPFCICYLIVWMIRHSPKNHLKLHILVWHSNKLAVLDYPI